MNRNDAYGGVESLAHVPSHFENTEGERVGSQISGMVLQALSNPMFHDRIIEQKATDPRSTSLAREMEEHVFASIVSGNPIDIAAELSHLGPDKFVRFAVIQSIMQRLGSAWDCDKLNFVQLTIAASRLQAAIRRIGQEPTPVANGVAPAILVCHCEHEKHMFPVVMIEEMFRARGWYTDIASTSCAKEVREKLDRSGAIAICLSWSDEELAEPVARLVEAAKTAINGRNIFFMAGGAATQHRVNWLTRKGVDKVCLDAYLGIKLAESFAFDTVCNSAAIGTGLPSSGTHAPA